MNRVVPSSCSTSFTPVGRGVGVFVGIGVGVDVGVEVGEGVMVEVGVGVMKILRMALV